MRRGSLDLDGLDLVADANALDDVHARGKKAEVRVHAIKVMGVDLHDEELRIVHLCGVVAASDADGPGHEREVVVFARHLVSARSGPGGVSALDDPVLDAMKRESLVEAAPRLLREASDSLRGLVRSKRERERPALRQLDGRLVRGRRGRWRRRSGCPGRATGGADGARRGGEKESASVHLRHSTRMVLILSPTFTPSTTSLPDVS